VGCPLAGGRAPPPPPPPPPPSEDFHRSDKALSNLLLVATERERHRLEDVVEQLRDDLLKKVPRLSTRRANKSRSGKLSCSESSPPPCRMTPL
jgi:hypothetical protein